MTTVDFNRALADAKSVSFEALPNGDYDVEVEKAEAVTSGSGKPMIKATMKVIVGPHTNRKIINNFVLSVENPVAVSIFFRHMKCFGLTDEFFGSLGTGTLDPVAQQLTGRRARLTLGQREWGGEMRNDVQGVKPYTGAPGGMGGPAAGPTAGPGPIAGPGVPASAPAHTPASAPIAATPQPAPAPAPAHAQPVASDGLAEFAPQQPTAVQPAQPATPPPPALPI